VQRRQRLVPAIREEREVQVVGVKVQDVELIGTAPHAIEHDQMMDERVLAVAVEPQRAAVTRFQNGRCLGITAREQSNVVPEPDQFFREIRYHALGPAVEPWRAAFVKRSDLRDLHDDQSP
jgi:hypothetical protein